MILGRYRRGCGILPPYKTPMRPFTACNIQMHTELEWVLAFAIGAIERVGNNEVLYPARWRIHVAFETWGPNYPAGLLMLKPGGRGTGEQGFGRSFCGLH